MEGLPIMRKQPFGFRGQYAEFDYAYLGSEEAEDGQTRDFYRQSNSTVKWRYVWLGRFVDSYTIPESGLGTCEVIGQGYFACIYTERHGPYTTRADAEMELSGMLNRRKDYAPALSRGGWTGVIAATVSLIGLGLLAWLIYQAVQNWG